MSTPLVLQVFANQVNQNASGPDVVASRQLAFGLTPGPLVPAVVGAPPPFGPNDPLFDNPRAAQFNFTLGGLTSDAIAGFSAGKKYTVTIAEAQ